MKVTKLQRKPQAAGKYGWDWLSDILCALFIIFVSVFLIFHLIVLYTDKSVLIFENSKAIIIVEGIALLVFIVIALDRFLRLWERSEPTHSDLTNDK
jgi:hypothetical protein